MQQQQKNDVKWHLAADQQEETVETEVWQLL